MMAVLWCMQTVLTILEIAGAYFFVVCISQERASGCRKWILMAAMGMLACLTIYQRTYSMYSRLWLVQCILICWIAVAVCYRKQRTRICIAYALYYETLYCLDLFLYIGFAFIVPKGGIFISQFQISAGRIAVYLIARCALAAFMAGILHRGRAEAVFSFQMGQAVWVAVLVLEHAGLVMCDRVFFHELEKDAIGSWKFFVLFYSFALVVLVFYFLWKKYQVMCGQLKTQNAIYCSRYEAMEKEHRERERTYHDFRNHMVTLQGLACCGKIDEVQSYLEELLKSEKMGYSQRTGHPTIDYLLYVKNSDARQKGIQVKEQYDCNLCSLEGESLKDWGALLGNLWDNAVEGCICSGERKEIFFSVRQLGNMIKVQIGNTCSPNVNPKRLRTTKSDPKVHGIGLQSIEFVVVKHEGVIDRKCKDGIFLTQIIMLE